MTARRAPSGSDRIPFQGHPLWQMATAALLFALMGAAAHSVRATWPWPVVAFTRCAVMAVVVVAAARWRGIPLIFPGGGWAIWARGTFGGTALLCTFYSLSRLPVADTVVIFALSPLWITMIAAVLERRPPSARHLLLLAAALAGVILMHRPGFHTPLFPLAIAFTGSVLVAVAMISLSRTGGFHPLSVVAHFSLTAAVISGLAVLLQIMAAPVSLPWAGVSAVSLISLLAVGITGTGGQLFMTAAYQEGRPSPVALAGLSQMLWAALFDAVLFGQPPDIWGWTGMGMIAAAVGSRFILPEPAPPCPPPAAGAG